MDRLEEQLAQSERARRVLDKKLQRSIEIRSRLEQKAESNATLLRTVIQEMQETQALVEQRNADLEETSQRLRKSNKELTRAQRLLEQSEARASDASRAKTTFLANITQSIRAPVNHIAEAVADLVQESVMPEHAESVETLLNATDVLLRALDDVAGFAHIEPAKLELDVVAMSVCACVEDVGRLVAHRAQHKGLELIVDVDPGLPPETLGDPFRLRQVLLNLANNAVQFTQCGRVMLSAHVGEGDLVRFEVRDTGTGIPEVRREQLLNGVSSAHEHASATEGSAGVGIAISRQLIRRMGGALRIESVQARGTTVSFTIPCPSTGTRAEPTLDLAGRTILVAEPHELTRIQICRLINSFGGTARPEIRADRAIARLREAMIAGQPIAAVLFGFTEESVGALRLKDAIRRDASIGQTPLLLMAPIAHLGQHGAAEGFDAVLGKPVRQTELRRALAAAVGIDLPVAAQIPPGKESRRVLVLEEDEKAQLSIRKYLESHGHSCDIVCTGRDALDLVERQDFDLIILDCQLRGNNGLETCAAIRTMEEQGVVQRPAPIVGILSGDSRDEEERARVSGIDGYLYRPVGRSALDRYLRALLTL